MEESNLFSSISSDSKGHQPRNHRGHSNRRDEESIESQPSAGYTAVGDEASVASAAGARHVQVPGGYDGGGPDGKERSPGGASAGRPGKTTWPWSKRDRLQRHPSLSGTVDEDFPIKKPTTSVTGGSHDERRDYFGVRSYLHNFYETYGTEANMDHRFVYDVHKQRSTGHCRGQWWRTMAMFGAGCLVIGVITISVGFLTPQRPIIIGQMLDDSGRQLVDRDAANFDFKLEVCRLVGLTMFSAGGLILAASLMIPTFLYRYCGDGVEYGDNDQVTAVMVQVDEGGMEDAALLPVKAAVPATEKITEVQPPRRTGEAVLIGDVYKE